MPGAGRRIWPRGEKRLSWSDYPFSYLKVCRTFEAVVLAVVAIALGFVGNFSRPTLWLVFLCVGLGLVTLSLILERVVWRFLPPGVQARIPYDAREALEKKGDIRSYREFLKLLQGGWHRR